LKIVSQKKIIQKEEYQKKINELRAKVKKYRDKRTNDINQLTKQRVNATKKLLDTINPILIDYSNEKSIAMIIQRKNIVIGKVDLDITNDIIERVDKKISKIKLD
jgi:outer membrane protein